MKKKGNGQHPMALSVSFFVVCMRVQQYPVFPFCMNITYACLFSFESAFSTSPEESPEQTFKKRDVTLGLSDGVNIEIVSGVTETDKVRNIQQQSI